MEDFKIYVFGREYEVCFRSEEEYAKFVKSEANGLAELYDGKLYLNKTALSETDMTYANFDGFVRKVLMHEIWHAIFFELGIREYYQDERLVDILAHKTPQILEVFNDKRIMEVKSVK